MSHTNTPLKYLFGAVSSIALVSTPANRAENPTEAQATCGDRGNLHSIIYRDINNRGFELVYGPPIETLSPISRASVIIRYNHDTTLYTLPVTTSSGYGSNYVLTENNALPLNFFAADLTLPESDTLVAELTLPTTKTIEPPGFLFISGLGSYDYYTRRGELTEASPPLILDTLWVLQRCQFGD
jgi:hypothetical protein